MPSNNMKFIKNKILLWGKMEEALEMNTKDPDEL